MTSEIDPFKFVPHPFQWRIELVASVLATLPIWLFVGWLDGGTFNIATLIWMPLSTILFFVLRYLSVKLRAEQEIFHRQWSHRARRRLEVRNEYEIRNDWVGKIVLRIIDTIIIGEYYAICILLLPVISTLAVSVTILQSMNFSHDYLFKFSFFYVVFASTAMAHIFWWKWRIKFGFDITFFLWVPFLPVFNFISIILTPFAIYELLLKGFLGH